MRTVDRTIVAIAGIAITHNVIAAGRGQQLISERVDDYRAARPWLTELMLTLLYLHLRRRLPPRADPFNWLSVLAERVARMWPGRSRHHVGNQTSRPDVRTI